MGQAPTSPKQFSEPSPAELAGRTHVRAVSVLWDPVRPARPLPRLRRRVVPDLMTEAGNQRFHHTDLSDLSPEERQLERAQILFAIGCYPDPPPAWLTERLELLERPSRRRT